MKSLMNLISRRSVLRIPAQAFSRDYFKDSEQGREADYIRRVERENSKKIRESAGPRKYNAEYDSDEDEGLDLNRGSSAERYSRDQEELIDIFDANDIAPSNRLIKDLIRWRNRGSR